MPVLPPELVSIMVGLLSSLSATYLPYLKSWFVRLTPAQKAGFILVVNIAIPAGLALFEYGFDWPAVGQAALQAFYAIAASQLAYLLNPQS